MITGLLAEWLNVLNFPQNWILKNKHPSFWYTEDVCVFKTVLKLFTWVSQYNTVVQMVWHEQLFSVGSHPCVFRLGSEGVKPYHSAASPPSRLTVCQAALYWRASSRQWSADLLTPWFSFWKTVPGDCWCPCLWPQGQSYPGWMCYTSLLQQTEMLSRLLDSPTRVHSWGLCLSHLSVKFRASSQYRELGKRSAHWGDQDVSLHPFSLILVEREGGLPEAAVSHWGRQWRPQLPQGFKWTNGKSRTRKEEMLPAHALRLPLQLHKHSANSSLGSLSQGWHLHSWAEKCWR